MTEEIVNETDKRLSYAWLAGLIDGEGWLGIAKISYARIIHGRRDDRITIAYLPIISIQMTHEQTLQRIGEITGRQYEIKYQQKNINSRPLYRWRTSTYDNTYTHLKLLHPYLYTKRLQANTLIEFIENRHFKRQGSNRRTIEDLEYCERYYRLLREMNQRGSNRLISQLDMEGCKQ